MSIVWPSRGDGAPQRGGPGGGDAEGVPQAQEGGVLRRPARLLLAEVSEELERSFIVTDLFVYEKHNPKSCVRLYFRLTLHQTRDDISSDLQSLLDSLSKLEV